MLYNFIDLYLQILHDMALRNKNEVIIPKFIAFDIPVR